MTPKRQASASRHRQGQQLPDARNEVGVVVQEKPWGTHYKLKAYVKESREQFEFLTDLTIRGKEALRAMNISFAQAPYAEARPRLRTRR